MEEYLRNHHTNDIIELLNNNNESDHCTIQIDVYDLYNNELQLCNNVIANIHKTAFKFTEALKTVQKQLLQRNDTHLELLDATAKYKEYCHIRFINLPTTHYNILVKYPDYKSNGLLVQISGHVTRMSQPRFIELKKEYVCNKCRHSCFTEGQYETYYTSESPGQCTTCHTGFYTPKSSNPDSRNCRDYQEITIKEFSHKKLISESITATLEDELVSSCQPGDFVTLCGTVERRCDKLFRGKKFVVKQCIRVHSIINERKICDIKIQNSDSCRDNWLTDVRRLGECKCIALLMTGEAELQDSKSSNKGRSQSHLLLVGDPGMGKSQLMKFVYNNTPRSIYTTGFGSTTAGLTVAAVQENGRWYLRAGALVLCDGGICCIDEFNSMKESDRSSIHEAMEQQTVSIAKAGFVCKLNARCSIVAGLNPKKIKKYAENEINVDTIGIGTPLMSRFDLIFPLIDKRSPELDSHIADHILNEAEYVTDGEIWSESRLQSYILSVKSIKCNMPDETFSILSEYYHVCRNDPYKDPCRTTTRLLHALIRLSSSHAKLMCREKVLIIDAVATIRLNESSYGFGRFLTATDLKTGITDGPTMEQVIKVLERLQLENLIELAKQQAKDYHLYEGDINADSTHQREKRSVYFQPQSHAETVSSHMNNKTIEKPAEIITKRKVVTKPPLVVDNSKPMQKEQDTILKELEAFNNQTLNLDDLDDISDLSSIQIPDKKLEKTKFLLNSRFSPEPSTSKVVDCSQRSEMAKKITSKAMGVEDFFNDCDEDDLILSQIPEPSMQPKSGDKRRDASEDYMKFMKKIKNDDIDDLNLDDI